MHKLKILVLLLFVIGFGAFNLPQAHADDRYCMLFSLKSGTTFSFDTQTIHVYKENNLLYVDVWERMDYNQEGVQEVITILKQQNKPTKGFQNLDYTLSHVLIAISSTKGTQDSVRSETNYALDGSALSEWSAPYNDYSNFKDVAPSSKNELVINMIEKYIVAQNLMPTN